MDDQNPQNPDRTKQPAAQTDAAPETPAAETSNTEAPQTVPPTEAATPEALAQQAGPSSAPAPVTPEQSAQPVSQQPAAKPQQPPAQPAQTQATPAAENQTHEVAPPSTADITPAAQPAPQTGQPAAQPQQTQQAPAASPPLAQQAPTTPATQPETPATQQAPAPSPAAADASAFDTSSGLSLEDDEPEEDSEDQSSQTDEEVSAGPQQPAMSETNEEHAALSAGLSLEEDEAPAPAEGTDATQAATAAAAAGGAAVAGAAQANAPIPKGLGVQTTQDGPSEYDFVLHGQPEFTMATIKLPTNGRIKVEAAAMVSMDTNVQMRTVFKGGFKRFLARESLFINEFISEQFPGTITIANGIPGDVRQFFLTGNEPLYLSSGAFLACGDGVTVNTEYQGLAKGFFAGAGFFLAQCEGKGSVFFNSYGGILEIDVKDEYLVDNNHIVGFTGGLEYKLQKFGGYKSLFLSGEGIVAKFTGQGKLWIQTRKIPKFVSWVNPYRRVSKGNTKGVQKFLPDSVKAFIPNK